MDQSAAVATTSTSTCCDLQISSAMAMWKINGRFCGGLIDFSGGLMGFYGGLMELFGGFVDFFAGLMGFFGGLMGCFGGLMGFNRI